MKFIIIYLCITCRFIACNDRNRRYLIFPRGNPTRHQFVAGVGLPVDLDEISVTVGYVFKAQYYLPYNVTQLYPYRNEIAKKRRNVDFEKINKSHEHNVDVEVKPSVDTHEDIQKRNEMRWTIYHAIEEYAKNMGYNGRECLLHAICETAAVPFTFSNGILGELIHVIMTPSTTQEDVLKSTDREYFNAEIAGRNGEFCDKIYSECDYSLLKVFSKVWF